MHANFELEAMRSGIRRKVDDLGRVVIPAGIRRSLGIREGDALEVSVQGDEVVLSKPVDQCVFCHSDQELRGFRDKAICASCASGVGTLVTGGEPRAGDRDETGREVPLPAWPHLRPSEYRVVAARGSPAVVRTEAISQAERHELPASTTAW